MATVELERVAKVFGRVRAVDGVTLRIEKGELFFLLGPSGCGKTTLLRMIAGFYLPEEGTIRFGDRDVSHVPPHKRNTGMVFQNYALWPHMDVEQNLAFGLEMRKVPAAQRRERIARALETVQMTPYARRMPNQLSGGQQQRVALARALVVEPDVVLLDEPLSNLDARLRLDMRAQLTAIQKQLGLTMIYVTHDQGEALSMADRLAILRDGRVEQVGTPREVYRTPASRFVADFIGETNLLPGRVRATGPDSAVETAAGLLQSRAGAATRAVGTPVCCSIRPEALRLAAGGDAPNRFSAHVERTLYLGGQEQIFLRLADGTRLKAVQGGDLAPPTPGARIEWSVAPEDVVLLPDDAAV